jgi:O-6-methylguanine DNA methyltransferase
VDIDLPLIGKIKVFATAKGICAIFLGSHREKESRHFIETCGRPIKLTQGLPKDFTIWEALTEYVEGKQTSFSISLDLFTGTPFQQEIWKVLEKIPYGQCVSYQWVAEKIGRPRATRAVGSAIGKNPIPILIPCHRVIRKDGSLGGFSSGLSLKKTLLRIEGCLLTLENPGTFRRGQISSHAPGRS